MFSQAIKKLKWDKTDGNVVVNFKFSEYMRKMFDSVSDSGGSEKKIQILPVGVESLTIWPRLFKGWIALSTG